LPSIWYLRVYNRMPIVEIRVVPRREVLRPLIGMEVFIILWNFFIIGRFLDNE